MSNHLTDKEIDYYVSGLSSGKDARRIREHISSCPQCAKITETLASVISEEPASAVPGKHVRETVMQQWHTINNLEPDKKSAGRPLFNRFNAWLITAASVILIISAYLFTGIIKPDEGFPLTINSITGEAVHNNTQAAEQTVFRKGDTIKTGTDGRASLTSEKYTLFMDKSSSVTLAENTRKGGILFILAEGTFISRSSGDLAYSFTCGRYDITPAGTDFMMKCSAEKLDVAVTQGKVNVGTPGYGIEINSGSMWSSDNPGLLVPVNPETAAMINAGAFKPVSPGKKSEEKTVKEPAANAGINESTEENSLNNNGTIHRNAVREKNEVRQLNRELRQDRREISDIKKDIKAERKGRNSE